MKTPKYLKDEKVSGIKKIEVGSRVIPYDGSYSLTIGEAGLEHETIAQRSIREQAIVIATDCVLPATNYCLEMFEDQVNDTIIRSDSGKIHFTQKRFLKLV